MFIQERHEKILEILRKEGKVFVKDLSKQFDISQVAIRKDLQLLEQNGFLTRTHGGAILERKAAVTSTFNDRIVNNIEIKHEIAMKAFDCVEDGDHVFLDISTTNFLLAQFIAQSKKRVTLITNMGDIGTLFGDNLHTTLICIGGIYCKTLGGVVGAAAVENICHYQMNKAFIGTGGINVKENKISNFDLEEGNTKKTIISQAKKTYVLASLEKFYMDATYNFASLDDIDFIITNGEPDKEINKLTQKHHVSIL